MILNCPSCKASYKLPIELPEQGRKVRCAKCEHVWKALPSDSEETPSLDEEAPPEAEESEGPASDEPEPQSIEARAPDIGIEDFDIDFREGGEESSETSAIDEASIEALLGETTQTEAAPEIEEQQATEESVDPILEDDVGDGEENGQEDIDALFAAEEVEEAEAATDEVEAGENTDITASFDEAPSEPDEDIFDNADTTADKSEDDMGFDQPQPKAEPEMDVPAEAEIPPIAPEQSSALNLQLGQSNKQQKTLLAAGWGALAVSAIGLAAVAYFNGEAVVRTIPGAANMYDSVGTHINVRGLEFRGVSYTWEADAGQPVLHVKGTVINLTDKALRVPTVVFALRDSQGAELFHWAKDIQQKPLSAGQSAGFAARIPSPPVAVRSLQVRFAKAK